VVLLLIVISLLIQIYKKSYIKATHICKNMLKYSKLQTWSINETIFIINYNSCFAA